VADDRRILRTGPEVRFTVNREHRSVPVEPERSLLEILRFDLGLTGAKYGCGEGECGACTVLLDGNPVSSCQVPVGELDGASVLTVEGLETDGGLNPVQRAFAELGAFQCGFCIPGMVVRASALLERNPQPSEAEVREAMQRSICRCCGYSRILRAVRRASELSVSGRAGSE
jgi:aerobic-type carbon monoxide dehydrogenase small subunit (CoxS/CutS family)